MSDLGPAVVGLIGAAFGSISTAAVSLGAQALQRRTLSDARRLEDREQWRRIATDAYVEAREGLGQLTPDVLEDSVIENHRARFEPMVQRGLVMIQHARNDLFRVAVLTGEQSISQAAERLAQGLQSYEHSYGRARDWAQIKYKEGASSRLKVTNENIFNKYWTETWVARKILVGNEKWDEPTEPRTGLVADLRDALRVVPSQDRSGSAEVPQGGHPSSPEGADEQE